MRSLCLAVLVCAPFVHAEAPSDAVDDRTAFERMRETFERAVNENRFDLLAPYIDPSFKGTSIAGTPMVGPDQIARFMSRARMLMGTGAVYRLKLLPKDLKIDGDRGHSSGTTEEQIILPDGRKLDYKSDWSIDLNKRDGKWLVSAADAKPNMRDAMTIAAHVIASRIWQAGLNLGRVKLWRPDWDQDNGYHNSVGIEAATPGLQAHPGLQKSAPKGSRKG